MTGPPGRQRVLPESIRAGEHEIRLRECRADGDARGVIQVLHGMVEYCARYDRFAAAASRRGYLVVTHNHRGHGPDAAKDRLGQFADRDGWNRVIDDVRAVRSAIQDAVPDLPVAMLGHSMGSFIAQSFVMREQGGVDALVLSGSNRPPRGELRGARLVAQIICSLRGRSSTANFLDRQSFGQFNDAFRPNRTAFDWLSRDAAEVDKYVADPLCGFVASNGLWADLLGGLLEITSAAAVKRLPASLPILLCAGEQDPVGGTEGVSRLASEWRRRGKTGVDVRIYAGARHEILNETNRREVTADILDWVDRVIGSR